MALSDRDLARIYPHIRKKVRFLSYPRELKEDLVQETMIYLWEERQHYDGSRNLFSYADAMLRCMRNTLIDLYRLKEPASGRAIVRGDARDGAFLEA